MSEFLQVNKKACCANCEHFSAGKCNLVIWIDGRHQAPEPTPPSEYCYLWERRDDADEVMSD